MKENETIASDVPPGECSVDRSVRGFKAAFREKHPMPIFSHWMGYWRANDRPILRTQNMGKTTSFPPILWEDLPDTVKGAYCAIEGVSVGDFEMAHRETGFISANGQGERPLPAKEKHE